MPSPFLGMDPYLERRPLWAVAHSIWIHQAADYLRPQAPTYLIDPEADAVWVSAVTGEVVAEVEPDIIAVAPAAVKSSGVVATVSTPAMSVTLSYPPERLARRQHAYLVLRAADEPHQVVTVVELLSYHNKEAGRDRRDSFHAKRRRFLDSEIHWVEIDLLRALGHPVDDLLNGQAPACDYMAVVSRATPDGRQADVYPFQLQDPMPQLPIPRRSSETDLVLHLKSVTDRTYDALRAPLRIHYDQPPEPPLVGSAAVWADQLLRQHGLRK